MKNRIELIAPAGDLDCLKVAIEAGADAVYLGGAQFGARAYANNFSLSELAIGVDYAHIRNAKVYVTVNTLVMDREIVSMLNYVKYLYEIGVDALIIQDMGVFSIIKKLYPDFPLHCSTQMSIHNSYGAKQMQELGASKVVLAREMNLTQIKEIVNNVNVEIEIFAHGALCIGYSGQCLWSSMIGGRSGNRGMCAQPCRKVYSVINRETDKVVNSIPKSYLMSTRDLKTIEHMSEIIDSGVSTIKIEGRMKKPEYVATVVKNYRDMIDAVYAAQSIDIAKANYELEIVFNREFTKGYLGGAKGRSITSTKRPDNRGIFIGRIVAINGNMIEIVVENNFIADGDGVELIDNNGNKNGFIISGLKINNKSAQKAVMGDTFSTYCRANPAIGQIVNKAFDSKLNERAINEYAFENKKKEYIIAIITVKLNEYPKLRLETNGCAVEVLGSNIVSEAMNKPLNADTIIEQLKKTGDTTYIVEDIQINLGENCFLSLKDINALRRNAIEALNHSKSIKRDIKEVALPTINSNDIMDLRQEISVGVNNIEQAESAINEGINAIYVLNSEYAKEILTLCEANKVKCFYALSNILSDSEMNDTKEFLKANRFYGLVISNIGQLKIAKELAYDYLRGNYTLNVFNQYTCDFYKDKLEMICASTELNMKDIKSMVDKRIIPIEILAYGDLPVMTTEYCPLSLSGSDNSCNKLCETGNYSLLDEKGKKFPILKLKNCRNQILNSDTIFLGNKIIKAKEQNIKSLRLDFYFEDELMVKEVIRLYKDWEKYSEEYNDSIQKIKSKGYTNGHFFRGAE